MAGLYSRLKNWLQDEKLTYTDLNSEFNNIINNSDAAHLGGASTTLGNMQATDNPGTLGGENYGAGVSMANEVQRLRFVLERIIGGSKKWYEQPISDIDTMNNFLTGGTSISTNRIVSGAVTALGQPSYVRPSGSGRTAVVIGATPLSYSVGGVLHTLNANQTTSAASAPVVATATLAYNLAPYDTAGGFSYDAPSLLVMSGAGAGITAKIGNWIGFKIGTEAMMGFVKSSTEITNLIRYGWLDSAGVPKLPTTHTVSDTITLEQLFFIFLTTTGTTDICQTNPVVSGIQPTSPVIGDYWLDTSAGVWKKYDGSIYNIANATLVGYGIADATSCLTAKPLDFSLSFSDLCKNDVQFVDASTISTRQSSINLSIYGTAISSANSKLFWRKSDTLLEGGAIGTGTYVLYVSKEGKPYISGFYPTDRRTILGGYYHINAPLRAIATISTDISGNFVASSLTMYESQPVAVNPTVGSFVKTNLAASVGTYPTFAQLGTGIIFPSRKFVQVTIGPRAENTASAVSVGTLNTIEISSNVVSPSGVVSRGIICIQQLGGSGATNSPYGLNFSFFDDLRNLDESAYVTYTVSATGTAGCSLDNYSLYLKVEG